MKINKNNKIIKGLFIRGVITLVSFFCFFVFTSVTTYAQNISNGDVIQNPNAEGQAKYDLYLVKIVEGEKYRRLILNPQVFESYGHLSWNEVKTVSASTMNEYEVSNLVYPDNNRDGQPDGAVYRLIPDGDTGKKEHLDMTSQEFVNQGYSWNAVYVINSTDFNNYDKSQTNSSNDIKDNNQKEYSILKTPLSGYITQDSKLTLENSPYTVIEDVIIAPDTTLIIEPGVKIYISEDESEEKNYYRFWIKGSLYAKGNKSNFISFQHNSEKIMFHYTAIDSEKNLLYDEIEAIDKPTALEKLKKQGLTIRTIEISPHWYGIYVDQYGYTSFEYTIIEDAKLGIHIHGNEHKKEYGYIKYSKIRKNKEGISCAANGKFDITHNEIMLNDTGIRGAYFSDILYNTIAYNFGDGVIESGLIQYNDIYENEGYGINTAGAGHRGINYNNITNNKTGGIREQNSYEVATTHNNIYDNDNYAYKYLRKNENGIVINNWWGTTNKSDIESLIYDFYDDPSIGIVNFTPISTSEISNAGVE